MNVPPEIAWKKTSRSELVPVMNRPIMTPIGVMTEKISSKMTIILVLRSVLANAAPIETAAAAL